MEQVKLRLEGDALLLDLSGNIDSTNAPLAEKEIEDFRAANPAKSAVIDCENLKYISSAGLRVVLRLRKAIPDTKVINVSPDVYEIFDITGFTEMMEVRKAYRVLSVEGCEVIGQGANGRVYRIDPETIVKAYRNPDALPEIQRERELARTAFVLGIPTAIPYDVVRIAGGGYGSVFELLNANSFAKLLAVGEMGVDEAAERLVALLKIIHGTVVKPGTVPDMKETALKWTDRLKGYLDPALVEQLRALFALVPEDDHLLHGDYHVKNVMLQDGESLLIDMDTLCHGHPVFELGSMFNAYVGYNETDHAMAERFLGIPYETATAIWDRELHLYLDGADEATVRSVGEKAMIVGYTRIMQRMLRLRASGDATAQPIIDNCLQHLEELLPRTNTLVF